MVRLLHAPNLRMSGGNAAAEGCRTRPGVHQLSGQADAQGAVAARCSDLRGGAVGALGR